MSKLVFAYGSNLSWRQMAERCPSAQVVSRAALKNFRLVFAGWSGRWGGAVATIEPAEGERVQGVIYMVSDADLERLDGFEGYPWVYDRKRLKFPCKRGGTMKALAYMMPAGPYGLPSKEYITTIGDAYRRLGFISQPLIDAVKFSHDMTVEQLAWRLEEERKWPFTI